MSRDKVRFLHYFLTVLLTVLFLSPAVMARQNVLIGSVSAGFDFVERDYGIPELDDVDDGDAREYFIGPSFEFQSLGQHNSLFVNYNTQLVYDDIAAESDTDIDHYLDFDWQQQLSRQWSYQIIESFAYTNDPTVEEIGIVDGEVGNIEPDPGDTLTRNLGNQRYWTNNLRFLTDYTYAQESNYQFNYGYRILRDDSEDVVEEDEYDEYDRHSVGVEWTHRYSPSWRSLVDINYVRGLYEDLGDTGLSQDLDSYGVRLGADYVKSSSSFFPVIYNYMRTDYEDLRDDITGHELSFGWDYIMDSRNHLIVGAGPSYVETDTLDGELGFNFLFDYSRTYQRGSFTFLIEKRYLSREFTGGDDTGLTDTTDFRIGYVHQLSRDLNLDLYALYTIEEILNPDGDFFDAALGGGDPALEDDVGDITYTRDSYALGGTLSYNVLQWLVASFNYEYYDQEGDVVDDSYDEHRVSIQFTASTELWRQ